MKSYRLGFEVLGVNVDNVRGKATTCPACSKDRKKSHQRCLSVDLKHGNYYCSHCQFKGRVDSDEWLQKSGEREMKRQLFNPISIQNEQKTYQRPKDNYQPISDTARAYLNSRGISDATIDRNKVTSKPHPSGEMLAFRYYFDNALRRVKYRNIVNKDFFQEANCKPVLYKLDDIVDCETCIITEGEIDALSFEEIGLTNAVSLDAGASGYVDKDGVFHPQSTDGKFKCIQMSARHLVDKKTIYIAMDSDAPGKYTADELSKRLGVDRCLIVNYPEGCKDANDVLVKHGKAALLECFERSHQIKIKDIDLLNDVYDDLVNSFENGEDEPERCYVKSMEEPRKFSWIPGFLYLSTGYPNHGKSEFIKYLTVLKSANDGDKWAFFSPEHAPAYRFYQEIIQTLSGRPVKKGHINSVTREELDLVKSFINNHFIFIQSKEINTDDDAMQSPAWILDRVEELSLMYGITGVVVDPWNQLDHIDLGKQREDLYLSNWLTRFKRKATNHNLKMVIIAHPTGAEGRLGTEPTIYSVSGGGMWNNKIDVGLVTHRPNFANDPSDRCVTITIKKAKQQYRFGKPGKIDFTYKDFWYYDDNGKSEMKGLFEKVISRNFEVHPEPVGSWMDSNGNGVIKPNQELIDEDAIPF